MALQTRPLHPGFGLEVDTSLVEALTDDALVDELHGLWRDHAVLVFRRQSLTEDELVAFSSRFGKCEIVSRRDILSPYRDEVIYFSTLRYADGRTVGGFAGGEELDWHSDQTFRPDPATGALLYGVEVPKDGGLMYWANQHLAYDRLPEDVKQAIEGRTGVYSYAKRLKNMQPLELKGKLEELKRTTPDVRHPVMMLNAATGRKALYADPSTLVSIEGLSEEENARILPILFETATNPEFVHGHKVMPGDVLMWDNGCTLHRRDSISMEQPRLMKRTTFRLSRAEHCVPH